MNVAKRPWYGQLKIKVSYTIVCYYVLLCPDKNTIVTVFLWIKGYANFEPTTPVRKKRAVMIRV